MTATNNADSITCFVTDRGIDIVLRVDTTATRTTVLYETLKSVIGNRRVEIKFDDKDDDVLLVNITKLFRGKLRRQSAGHFFSFLRPLERAKPITIAEARERVRQAKNY